MRRFAVLILAALALGACSKPAPPAGRWAGQYEARDILVDSRLEIEKDGQVRVSAPYLEDVGDASDEDRAGMRARLASDLAEGWDEVAARPMDFDGRVFRKPGGVAPQIEWNPDQQRMTIVVYFGRRPALRFVLRAVDDFTADPWAR